MTEILYNQLPHILEAQHVEMPKVQQLKNVLKKYGISHLVGIVRLHKHFDLEKEQKLVWKIQQKTASSSVQIGDYSPYVTKFSSNGQLLPTEYYEGQNLWAELSKRDDFRQWIHQIFEIIGNQTNLYGLILNATNFGDELELTNEKERTQTVIVREKGVKQKGEVTTKYYGDGKIGECNYHVGSCVHCGHCNNHCKTQ